MRLNEALPEFIAHYLELTREGNEAKSPCCFCEDTGKSLSVSEVGWRCNRCGTQEEHGSDAVGFYASWLGITREEAAAKLGNGATLPPSKPIPQAKLKRPAFFGVKQAHDRPEARIWIHDRSEAVWIARELIPDRIHLGLVAGRSWDDLGLPPERQCVLVPCNTATARATMDKLAARLHSAGHTVRVVNPTDRDECWSLVDAHSEGMTAEQVITWVGKRASLYTNGAAQQVAEAMGLGGTLSAVAAPPFNDAAQPSPGIPPEAAAASPSQGVGNRQKREPSPLPESPAPIPAAKGNGASKPAQPPLTPPERAALQQAEARQAVLDGLTFTCIADVRPEAVKWLWPGRIPLGELTMIVGDPGLGKSQITSSLSSVVTNGGQWPVTRERCDQGSVLILSAEDNIKHTIRPRLDAAGADVRRCHTLQAVKREDERGNTYPGSFNLANDLAKLAVLLDHLQDVRLVIIDPVSAYLGETDSHKNAEVRGMLAPLTDLAGSRGAAIVLVSHLTKSQSANALMRVQGSIAFAALCRAVWGVAADKDNPQRRLFMPLKNNLGQDKTGLAYAIESATLESADAVTGEPIETSRVMWEAALVEMGAEEAFSGALTHEERTDTDGAKDFLREALSDGRVKTTQIHAAAKAAGHSLTTIGRAKRALKVVSEKEGFGAGAIWYWRLKSEPFELPAQGEGIPRDWQSGSQD